MDRRLTASNGRVAAKELVGKVDAASFVEGRAATIAAPVADLLDAPGGALDRQLLFGAPVRVFEDEAASGCSFVQAGWDGYVGYVATDLLGPEMQTTHRVTALATHIYPENSIKSRPLTTIPFGAEVAVKRAGPAFCELADGSFVPTFHLAPFTKRCDDWVAMAEQFLGVPYLWGGNSLWGIDCSGLVQTALRAANHMVPGDSDLQARGAGQQISAEQAGQRGDLVFWDGHVAMFLGDGRLLHANGFHMATRAEPVDKAMERIAQREGKRPTGFRRIVFG